MAATTYWQACSVNCGSRCALRLQVQDGTLVYVETDNLPESVSPETNARCPQMRACAKGRSIRFWLNSPDRLNYPMKRVGKRGEGSFERISWDEAIKTIATEIQRIVNTYGNEAVFLPYATGLYPASGSPFERLMNCYGGHLGAYSDYSCAQMQAAIPFLYGDDGYYSGSTLGETVNSDLVIFFGNNPAITRLGGGSAAWEFRQAQEQAGFKLICIDPRYPETLRGKNDEWIPVRPGTDAALVAGIAHTLITEDLIDHEFLRQYCIGFDSSTLPAGVAENASYKDYVLGTGPDGIAKTPRWASAITGIPDTRIVSLARELAAAKAPFIAQGWGPQRHENGELTARAIPLLAILVGKVGLPGTNTGTRERFVPFTVPEDYVGNNPVSTRIPVFLWSQAVEQGTQLTSANAGVRGAECLHTPIKMLICHAGNCLTNQHANINRTHDILTDESLCEFIVVCDVMMTDSARYADILLPDIARAEQANLISSGSADTIRGLVQGGSWANPDKLFERRRAVDVALAIAREMGVEDAFKNIAPSDKEMLQQRIHDGKLVDARIPPAVSEASLNTAPNSESGILHGSPEAGWLWRVPYQQDTVGLRAFRQNPEMHPLKTSSGKIEIYSQGLAALSDTLEYDCDQTIHPLPIYAAESEGWNSSAMQDFPYQLIGYHAASHVHSSYANVAELAAIAPHEMLMNTLDAQREGIVSGMRVFVENNRGTIVVPVRVSPLIMPGVLALPQGAWHKANMQTDRIDYGGCINTLTNDRPTPLGRGNAQHSILVRVRKMHERMIDHA